MSVADQEATGKVSGSRIPGLKITHVFTRFVGTDKKSQDRSKNYPWSLKFDNGRPEILDLEKPASIVMAKLKYLALMYYFLNPFLVTDSIFIISAEWFGYTMGKYPLLIRDVGKPNLF